MYIGGVSNANGSNRSGWYFNIMRNPTDGTKGSGATTKFNQDKFRETYHNVSSVIGLLKDHCKRKNKIN
eukprot:7258545-Ditylum_brightwellii.AAC.1